MRNERLSNLAYFLSDAAFGRLMQNFEWRGLKKQLEYIDYPYSEGRYLGLAFLCTLLALPLGFLAVLLLFVTETLVSPVLILLPFFLAFGIMGLFMAYPALDFEKKKKSIERDLPLAILTMSTIVDAGAPPQYMFAAISNSPDYPRLGKEAAKLVRFVDQMGLSFSEAVMRTAEVTPSIPFRRFLKELATTLKSGGDLRQFMSKRAQTAYGEYINKLELSSKAAETMGDVYSIIMIAGPIFLFFSIMLLGMFAGDRGIFGFAMDELLLGGVILIGVVNLGFILFMEITNPAGG